jgi:hypothetical protein
MLEMKKSLVGMTLKKSSSIESISLNMRIENNKMSRNA